MIFVKSLLVIFLLNFFSSFAFKTPNHIKILERSPTACKLVQTIDTSYNLAIGLGLTTFASCIYDQLKAKSINKWGVSASTLVLTFILGYVTVKTSSVKFSFDDTSFSLVKSDGSSLGQHPLWPSLGERGDYRWKYKRILNFSLLPNADLPLFLYLKETETPDVDIIQAPFSLDKLNGQVVFITYLVHE